MLGIYIYHTRHWWLTGRDRFRCWTCRVGCGIARHSHPREWYDQSLYWWPGDHILGVGVSSHNSTIQVEFVGSTGPTTSRYGWSGRTGSRMVLEADHPCSWLCWIMGRTLSARGRRDGSHFRCWFSSHSSPWEAQLETNLNHSIWRIMTPSDGIGIELDAV